MLLIEKVLILRSSDIFQNTPEQELVGLAGILEEMYLEPEENLFSKGDKGTCMYFIYKGQVRIHDGNYTLAVLEDNDIVGELSVLDSESRSASATTIDETILLKLEQEPFYEIMMNNVEVLKGILNTLCRRLRIMDDKSVSFHNKTLPAVPTV
ncbi:cyclic nucleotide-binding domain-containing protein [Pontibacter saemangeumensis]|uniref:Cyclic nucleotide-binding domain-containing protein n=1 Tax=Pontibacter saemangeumensis TaxID=1084525 RepID=A0ABP8L7I9_9BACT